jgi:diadenosine tetraphosphate (Ap4A) HIT family hydrolase
MTSSCLSCQLVQDSDPVRSIVETAHFHAHQDVAYPVPGQVIVAARRHLKCLDELSDGELGELLPLLARIRRAMRVELAIDHVYYFYNEDTTHHFHVWMVPRHPWMSQFGRSIESVRPVLLHARDHMNTAENQQAVEHAAEQLRRHLSLT